MRSLQWVLAIALAGFAVYRGIIPAFERIDSDFPNYYTASKLWVEGKDLSRIYDDDWFQVQILTNGIEQEGKFSPFPPVTVLLLAPLAEISPLVALRIWTTLNIGFLAVSIILLQKVIGLDVLMCACITLASGIALANNFRLGQAYIFLHLIVTTGYFLWKSNRLVSSGALFGVGAALKYFPLVFLPLLFRPARRAAGLSLLCMFLALSFVGMHVVGFHASFQFLTQAVGSHAAGLLQNPYSSNFQSWNSLFRTLFVQDSQFNPHPFFQSTSAFGAALSIVLLLTGSLLVISWQRLRSTDSRRRDELRFALLGIWGLLVSPATATYHALLLILPVAFLIRENISSWKVEQFVIALTFGMMGFIPYSFFHRFDMRGLLSVAAYPRLFLLTILFAAAVSYTFRIGISDAGRLAPHSEH